MRLLSGSNRKKGSLELSTNAIVVIVLAFVMLGLGLGVVQMLRSNVGPMIPDALNLADLDKPPTPENPLTIPDTIRIQVSGDTPALKVGYYNADAVEHTVSMKIKECYDPDTNTPIDTNKIPTTTTLSQKVAASRSAAFNVIFKPVTGSSMTGGRDFLCTFSVYEAGVAIKPSKQITVSMIS